MGVVIVLLSITPPGIHYAYLLRNYRPPPSVVGREAFSLPDITIFVPARDESAMICGKLEEILSLEYPRDKLRILVIDSGSEDNTGMLAESFLMENAGEVQWHVERLEKSGKSLAVNRALSIIDTEFFVMTDVDCRVGKNSLVSMMGRFMEDEEIGAICGCISITDSIPLQQYRRRFNILRLRESGIDSTPIFEGSIRAFKMSSISPREISVNINADDSQLALISRRNGYRAIMDEKVEFFESSLPKKEQIRRSLRRAQGITRTLYDNRDLVLRDGKFGLIFLQNFYFYIVMPWISMLGTVVIFFSLIFYFLEPTIDPDWPYLISITTLVIICILKFTRNFFFGIILLLWAQILSIAGIKLNIWKPFRKQTVH